MRAIAGRLTYANVVATLALFLALGGGAYAVTKLPANSVGTKQLRNKAVTPKKVAPATVELFKGQKGDRGPAGADGAAGAPGAQGAPGATGETGAPGSAVGYAEVIGGNVVAANSKNVTQANLSHPGQGIWCFDGMPFTPHNAQVTVEAGARIGFAFHPAVSSCASAQMEVVITDTSGSGTNSTADFMVAFN